MQPVIKITRKCYIKLTKKATFTLLSIEDTYDFVIKHYHCSVCEGTHLVGYLKNIKNSNFMSKIKH